MAYHGVGTFSTAIVTIEADRTNLTQGRHDRLLDGLPGVSRRRHNRPPRPRRILDRNSDNVRAQTRYRDLGHCCDPLTCRDETQARVPVAGPEGDPWPGQGRPCTELRFAP